MVPIAKLANIAAIGTARAALAVHDAAMDTIRAIAARGRVFPDLAPRLVSGGAMVLALVLLLRIGGVTWAVAVGLVFLLAQRELVALARRCSGLGGNGLPVAAVLSAIVALAALAAVQLRETHSGTIALCLFFCTVCAAEVGGYFCGRLAGGLCLSPQISPGNTWSGALCGACSGVLAASFLAVLLDLSVLHVLPGAILSVAASQAGDLCENWLKREADVKVSAALIPGHGGVLDRIDGMSFALVAMVLSVLWAGA
jgi:phosphatidate cytidylyltransferase